MILLGLATALSLLAPRPAQETGQAPVPARRVVEASGEALGAERSAGLRAAREDALARAVRELYREEGLAEPLQAVADRLAALDGALRGFLATETLEEAWDEAASLARVRLRVEADRAAFRQAASAALRVQVACEGPLAERIVARFRDRFARAGFEVVLEGAAEGVDAIVAVTPVLEQEPGGEAGFRAWRGGLGVQVVALSARDDARIVLADRRFGTDDPVLGSDAETAARKAILSYCEEAADLAAERILAANAAGARRTVIVLDASERYLVQDLLDAIGKRGAPAGVAGVGQLAFDPPRAVFRLVLDRRGETSLGAILESLDLSEGRRIRVLREAGSTILIRIEAP